MNSYLRQKRIELNLTQTEAAEKIGVSVLVLMNWENRRFDPSVDQLKAISAAYGENLSDFLDGIEHTTIKKEPDTLLNKIISNRCLFPESLDIDKLNITLNGLDIDILFSIKLCNRLGVNPIHSMQKITIDPIILNQILDKLLDFKLISIDNNSCVCFSDLGVKVIEAIEKHSCYRNFNAKEHLPDNTTLELLNENQGFRLIKLLASLLKDNDCVTKELLETKIKSWLKLGACPNNVVSKYLKFLFENDYIYYKDGAGICTKHIKEKTAYLKQINFYDKENSEIVNPMLNDFASQAIVLPTPKTKELIEILKNFI